MEVMESLADGVVRAVMNCRDLIGGDTLNHFEPLLKLFDYILVTGIMTDDDIRNTLILFDPASFDEDYRPGTTQKGIHSPSCTEECKGQEKEGAGLLEITLAEGAKLQMCCVLNHLMDIQLRHRVESLIAFSEGFVTEAQTDQAQRYADIKQSDLPPAETAKKTKEFRCPPKEQMLRMLNFKVTHSSRVGRNDGNEEKGCRRG